METLSPALNMNAQKALFITMVLQAWNTENAKVSKLLDTLSDEQFMAETAPGRNRGIYLVGHLVAVGDRLFPLLGLGERLYPHLDKMFLTSADRSVSEIPSMTELKKYWQIIDAKLSELFKNVSPDEWFNRHTAVSAEDFAKEPHRNKLNVIINRTNHTSYHLGQLVYLVKK